MDYNIYRTNGSLRLTDVDCLYRLGLPQIAVQSRMHTAILRAAEKKTKTQQSGGQERDTRARVKEYLEQNGLVGWAFRSAKNDKNGCIVDLNRTAAAPKNCDICNRDHAHDNTLYLRLTPKRITQHCRHAPRKPVGKKQQ
jgi:hypothetical protein